MSKDYYNILGLERDASAEEIKKSFRKLSLKYHPDKQNGKSDAEKKEAEEKFKDVAEAYSVLSDKDKKARYDTFGTVDDNGFGQSGGFSDMDDIMERFKNDFFGGGFSQRNHQQIYKGTDKRLRIKLTIRDILNGGSKTVQYKVQRPCDYCGGYGSADKKETTCSHCHGTGQYTNVTRNGNTIFQQMTTCPYCGGTGSVINNPCKHCNGTGLKTMTETLTVEIPSIDRLGGTYSKHNFGNSCVRNKGVNGDLLFDFVVEQDDKFFINNEEILDINTIVDVPVLDCITGCEIQVPYVDGKKMCVTIPQGTNNGDIVSVQKKGFRSSYGSYGRFNVIIRTKMPKQVSKEELKLIDKLRKTNNFK